MRNFFWYKGSYGKKGKDSHRFKRQSGFERVNAFPLERPTLIIPLSKNGLLVAGYYRDRNGYHRLVVQKLNEKRKSKELLHDFITVVNYLPGGSQSCIPLRFALDREELILEVAVQRETREGRVDSIKHLTISTRDFLVRELTNLNLSGFDFKRTSSECSLGNGIRLKFEMTGDLYSSYEARLLLSQNGKPWRPIDAGIYTREYKFTELPLLEKGPNGHLVIAGVRGNNHYYAGKWTVGIERISPDRTSLGGSVALDLYPDFPDTFECNNLESALIDKKNNIILVGAEHGGESGAEQGFVTTIQKKSYTNIRLKSVQFRHKTYKVLHSYLKGFLSRVDTLFTFGNFDDGQGRSWGIIFRSKDSKRPYQTTWLKLASRVYQLCQGLKPRELYALTLGHSQIEILQSRDDGKLWKKVGQFRFGEENEFDDPHLIITKGSFYLIFTRFEKLTYGEIWASRDLKKWSLESKYLFPESRSTYFHCAKVWGEKVYIQGDAEFESQDERDLGTASFLLEVDSKSIGQPKVIDSVHVGYGEKLVSHRNDSFLPDLPLQSDSNSGLSISESRLIYPIRIGGFNKHGYEGFSQTLLIRIFDFKSKNWSSHYIREWTRMPILTDIQIIQQGNGMSVFGSYDWERSWSSYGI